MDGPKFNDNVRDGDDRCNSICRPPPKAEPFERNSPHWDGRWVDHSYLPSQCNEEEAAVNDLETTNHDNDEDDNDSLQNGGASRDGEGDGGDGSSGSN